MTVKVCLLRVPTQTTHFNAGQKAWVSFLSGAQAAKCVGKFRGRGRYVSAWVHWSDNVAPLQVIEVERSFAAKHNLHVVTEA